MTTPPEPTENTAESHTDRPEIAQEPPEPASGTDGTDDQEPAGKEAARYRRQLRETEAERDHLRDRLEVLQRAEIERLALEQNVARPAAIWRGGVDLGALLDDAGNVDPTKAAAAITAAVESLGLAVRAPIKPDPSQGARGGGPDSSWSRLLNSTTKG